MLVAAILSVFAGMASCINIEDTYGANLKNGTINFVSSEKVDGKTYKADIVVDFLQPELAALDFGEAGIILKNEDGSLKTRIPLTTSLSNLHDIKYTFPELAYDEEYTLYQYILTYSQDDAHTALLFESETFTKLQVPGYAHIAIESITASVSGTNVDVVFKLNGTYNSYEHFNDQWDLTLCFDKDDFDKDQSRGRIVLDKNSIKKEGNTFHATFNNMGINQDYYLRADFKLNKHGQYVYSDIIKVHTEGEPHSTDCAVDLGLSVLWSSHNLGTTNPYGFGTLWGEQTKFGNKVHNFYFYRNDIDRITWEWENGWRMPTHKELEELLTTCTATLEYADNNINKYFRLTAPNGNSILLPLYCNIGCICPDGVKRYCTFDYYGPGGLHWNFSDRDAYRSPEWIYLRGVRSK